MLVEQIAADARGASVAAACAGSSLPSFRHCVIYGIDVCFGTVTNGMDCPKQKKYLLQDLVVWSKGFVCGRG